MCSYLVGWKGYNDRITISFSGCYDFDVAKGHAAALGYAVGIESQNSGFDWRKLDGLPDGIIHNVREFARGHLRPMLPVGRCPEGVVGNQSFAGILKRNAAKK